MSLMNLLQAALGAMPQQTPDIPTDVDELVVTAPKKAPPLPPAPSVEQSPQGVPFNYDNSQAAAAVQAALMKLGTPMGGSANPGIYGLLPERMQHGTLRNVLGAIGDAFLVQGGGEANYANRMSRQQIGQAMAGYDPDDPDAVQAAIQRVATTGAPDSIDLAKDMQKDYGTIEAKRVTADQTAEYRRSSIDNRNQNIFARQGPVAQSMVAAAENAEDYRYRYELWDRRAKAIDPNSDAASAYGIPYPEDWKSMPGYGMTSDQQARDEDRDDSESNTRRGQDIGYQGRIDSAQISSRDRRTNNGARVQAYIDLQDSGIELSPAQQADFDNLVGKKPGKRGLPVTATHSTTGKSPPKATPKAGAPLRAIPVEAVRHLKANPKLAKEFDAYYGKGQAAKILGK